MNWSALSSQMPRDNSFYFGAEWGVFLRSVEGDDALIMGETHLSSEPPANYCEFESSRGKPNDFLSRWGGR
jgi:hypothetical protein